MGHYAAAAPPVIMPPEPHTMLVPSQYGHLRFGVQDALNWTFVPLAKALVQIAVASSYTASLIGSPRGRSRMVGRETAALPAKCQPPAAM